MLRNINVTNSGSTSDNLLAADQLTPVSLTLPAAPAGYTAITFAPVIYLSGGGVMGSVNASLISYRPVSGFATGDRYAAMAITGNTTSAFLMSAEMFASGAPTLALPTPWAAGSLSFTQTAHPNVSGLSRTESDLRSYRFYLQFPGAFYYTATVSKGWLGSTTSYALPDLSANTLLGYTLPPNGSTGFFSITASLSNTSLVLVPSSPPTAYQAGDYLQEAGAYSNYTVGGGGPISIP